jgi:DedD protein
MRLPFFNRSSSKNNVPVEDHLTEDPERQRARHRLIGAVFLVTVAVAGLPIIFDSEPKNYHNDVAIQIIQPGSKDAKPEAKAETKPETKPESASNTSKPSEANVAKKEEAKSDKAPPVAKTLDKGEEVLSILENRKPSSAHSSASAAPTPGGKFVVQIGAFSSEERVKNWQKKLTEQKVTSYIEIRNNKEGVKLHLLRSGPYADRASAEAAEKKIKYIGLSPKIVETKSE